MREGSESNGERATGSSVASTGASTLTVVVFARPNRNRGLLTEFLGQRYAVRTAETMMELDGDWDLCIVDSETFRCHRDPLRNLQETHDPEFKPLLVLRSPGDDTVTGADLWDVADDVMETPVRKAELAARVENLLERRAADADLLESRAELSRTVDELRLKERAMDASPVGITISDPSQPDNPLVYVNEAFERLTGYESAEVLGRNCRFLQGPGTDPETVETVRTAIDEATPVSVDILNYRRNGSTFWNKLDISPVFDDDGVTNYVGFQVDITDRKIREERLGVMNRLLTHNLRNSLNVIGGYADLLESAAQDTTIEAYADEIAAVSRELEGLSEEVYRVERSLRGTDVETHLVVLDRVIRETAIALDELAPDVRVTVDVEDPGVAVDCPGVPVAIKEAVLGLLRNNERDSRELSLSVSQSDRAGWVDLIIEDNGRGLPDFDVDAINRGRETPLEHPDGIGLWLIHWVVGRAGGDVTFGGPDSTSSCIKISLPANDSREDALDGA